MLFSMKQRQRIPANFCWSENSLKYRMWNSLMRFPIFIFLTMNSWILEKGLAGMLHLWFCIRIAIEYHFDFGFKGTTLWEDNFLAALWPKHILFHLLRYFFKRSKPTIEDFYEFRYFCSRFVRNSFKKSIFSECVNLSAAMKWSFHEVAFLETKLKINFTAILVQKQR